jgi:hypothetical protein
MTKFSAVQCANLDASVGRDFSGFTTVEESRQSPCPMTHLNDDGGALILARCFGERSEQRCFTC